MTSGVRLGYDLTQRQKSPRIPDLSVWLYLVYYIGHTINTLLLLVHDYHSKFPLRMDYIFPFLVEELFHC